MPKQRIIGSHKFATTSDARGYIKVVLNRLPMLEPITGDDHDFLVALLKTHERAAEKTGVGVKHFTVEPSKGGTRCFYITRVDGTRDDFSTGKCLKG